MDPKEKPFDAGELAAGMFEFPVAAPQKYEIPRVKSVEEVGKLSEGSEFIDPTGKTRVKPYAVKAEDPETFRRIPDGAEFTSPDGVVRRKPVYESVGVLTQAAISLSRGDEKRIQTILADAYGAENVKREPLTNELYVEKDGKFYKPGRGIVAPVVGELAGAALPTIMGTGGGLLGATAGAPTVVGAPIGGMAGAVAGASTGEYINQLILNAAGYPTSMPELLKAVGKEAAYTAAGGALGEVGGRVIGRAAQAVPAFEKLLPAAAAKFVGASPEKTTIAAELARRGYSVPLTSYAGEVPYAKKLLEFSRTFRKEGPLEKQLEKYSDKELFDLFQAGGLASPKSFTRSQQAVAMEPLGQAIKDSTIKQNQIALDRQEAAIFKWKELAAQRDRLTTTEFAGRQRAIMSEFEAASAYHQKTADQMVDAMFGNIENKSAQLASEAGVTLNSGQLVRGMETQIRELRQALRQQAETMYTAADVASGGMNANVAPLRESVQELINSLPEGFAGKYGYMIKALEASKSGAMPFGQLHNLRSMLRHDVDWASVTSSPTQGAKKKVLSAIDAVIHDAEAHPQLKQAATLLDKADEYYAKNFPRFKNEQVRWTLKQVQDGMPPDASVLAERFIQAGETEQTRQLRKIAGPQLWKGVLAADTKSMLDNSVTVAGNYDVKRFVSEIEKRIQNGTLEEAYGKSEALQLQAMATRLKAYSGGQMPVNVTQGDTLMDVIKKAAEASDIAKRAAAMNPAAALSENAKLMATVEKTARANLEKEMGQNPLSVLFKAQPSIGGIEAADVIFRSPDKMLAVARTFGTDSPEVQMLRQVWWQKFFQRDVKDMAYIASELRAMEPSVERMMFPETPTADLLKKIHKIGREMEFLFPAELADVGSSLAGASRVLNPTGYVPGGRALRSLPVGGNFLARYGLGWAYTTAEWALSHPRLALFIEKGLSGSEAERQTAKEVLQASYEKWLMRGRGAGYFAGSAAPQFTGESPPPKPTEAAPRPKSWRDNVRQTDPSGVDPPPAPAADAPRRSWRDRLQ